MGRYAFLILKIVTYNTGKGDKWTICITHSYFTLAECRHDECYRTRTFCCKQGGKSEKVGKRIPAKEKGSLGNKAGIETEEETVCKVEKTGTGRTEIKEGIRGTR